MKEKKKNMFAPLGKVFAYMKNSIPAIIVALILVAAAAVLTIIGPDKIGEMTTLMQKGLYGEVDMSGITKIGITLAVIYIAGAVFNFIQHYIMATVTLKTSKRMRGNLSEKINKVPMSYFNKTSQGDILSRITNDISTLQQGLANSMPVIVSAAAQFVGCLIMMFATEWRLALCVLGVTFIGMFLLMMIVGRSQK